MPAAGTVQAEGSILHACNRDGATTKQSMILRKRPTEARSFIPPPPPLKDVVIRTKISQIDQQHDTAAGYQANFTGVTTDTALQPLLPPLPPGYEAYAPQVFGTPMVTYHVCRICMRPRSDRYHREHPIAPYTVPPPPGICRRCRVVGDDERPQRAEFVKVEESAPIRIGLDCIIPKRDVLTHEEVREEMGRGYEHVRIVRRVKSSTRVHVKEKDDKEVKVVYRYVVPRPVSPTKEDSNSTQVSVENLAALDVLNSQKVGSPKQSTAVEKAGSPEQSAALEKPDAPEQSVALEKAGFPTQSAALEKSSADVAARQATDDPPCPIYTESDIRRFARDEVVRYRQAERIIDAHPGPYAHGRLQQVQQKSKTEPAPPDAASLPRSIEPAPQKVSIPWRSEQTPVQRVDSVRKAKREEELVINREIRHEYEDDDHVPAAKRSAQRKASTREQDKPSSNGKHSTTSCGKDTSPSQAASASQSEGRTKTKNVVKSAGRADSIQEVTNRDARESAPSSPTLRSDNDDKKQRDTFRRMTVIREIEAPRQRTPAPSTGGSHRQLINDRESRHRVEVIREVTREDESQRPPSTVSAYQTYADYKDGSVDYSIKRDTGWTTEHKPLVGRNDLDVLADTELPIQAHQSSRSTTKASRLPDPDIEHYASASLRSSDWTDKEYWKDQGTIETASRHSRLVPVQVSNPTARAQGSSKEAYNAADHDEDHRRASATPKLAITPKLATLEDDRSWYENRTRSMRLHEPVVPLEAARVTPSDRQSGHSYYASTKRSSDHKRPLSEQSTPAEYEYEYHERIVQPDDRAHGRRPFDESPPAITRESETLYVYKPKLSKTAPSADAAPKKTLGVASKLEIPGTSSLSQNPAGSKSSMRSAGAANSSDRTRWHYDQDGEKVTQVRFANKVAFSPTPPCSDDYPPSAEKRNDRRDARRSERRHTQVEIDQAYEIRVPQQGSENRGRSPRRAGSLSEQAFPRSADRQARSPAETETTVPFDQSKRLARAWSESPSRETFRLQGNGAEQQQRRRSPERCRNPERRQSPERRRSLERRQDGFVDRYGPYRKETREESMVAACGSPTVPTRGTVREV